MAIISEIMDAPETQPSNLDRLRIDIVQQFLLTLHAFRHLQEKYAHGALRFQDWAHFVDDQGESVLFRLKESTQRLCQQSIRSRNEKEQIFDLTIRSIFHLAMKAREDLYTLEIFAPKYAQLSPAEAAPPERKKLVQKFQDLLLRAETSLREGIEEIATLLQDAYRQFKELLSDYRGKPLLLRFFTEEEAFIQEKIGEEGFREILGILSGQDEVEAYRLAGESFLESGFFDQAVKAFRRALGKKPHDESLRFILFLSQALGEFFSFSIPDALNSIEKCLSIGQKVGVPEKYRRMMRRVCQKINEDLPGPRREDLHREILLKARALQNQIENLPLPPNSSGPH